MPSENIPNTARTAILDPYGISVSFPGFDFPYWEQLLIREWLVDDSERGDFLQSDAWNLWEAVFWHVFKKPPCSVFNPDDPSSFIMKASTLIRKLEMDCQTLLNQFEDLLRIHNKSIRAIAAGKLEATIVAQREYVIPKDFIAWEDANKLKEENCIASLKSLRSKALQKLTEFRRSDVGRELSINECLDEQVICVEIFKRTSKNPQSSHAVRKYLTELINKECPDLAVKRGRPPAKKKSCEKS
ncbi:MAG: hypothetical protein Q8L98_00685 [Chlamydiales bacterium]|nr:hypothetical protein [Chlamydiales bacterium]